MADILVMDRPQRWDSPYDPNMGDEDVERLLARPEFSSIDASRFPPLAPLSGILKNDCRIVSFAPGDIIVREGDYGNSAYLILDGSALVVRQPGLPSQVLGRSSQRKKSLIGSMLEYWRNPTVAEVRDTKRYKKVTAGEQGTNVRHTSLYDIKNPGDIFAIENKTELSSDHTPPLRDEFFTIPLSEGLIFGADAALGRVRRSATIYAETPCTVLELRWQALRDIKARDDTWKQIIEDGYRRNQLTSQLLQHPFLQQLDEETLTKLAEETLFETFGSFEWHLSFNQRQETDGALQEEHIVARQGNYPDGLLLVTGGFGRVSVQLGSGERTLCSVRRGDYFGLDELYDAWKNEIETALETSLSTLGYLNVLRIPYRTLCDLVFPHIKPPETRLIDSANRPIAEDTFLEWMVEERFINGTKTMLIDTEKCVRCDDCVRACSATHGGNPRFIRHGKMHDQWMVANACMHCVDPVCMIGCPTGAIHRTTDAGSVVINDDTCIGCGTCANSCPYNNIRLVGIHDSKGRPVLDPASQEPIRKATKCDLCSTQPGGPACVRACPHDALKRVDIQSLIQ